MLLMLVGLLLGPATGPAPTPVSSCSGPPLLSVPLTSTKAFRTEAPGGLVVLGVPNGVGWEVSVFAASAPQPAPDLVAQPGLSKDPQPLDVSAQSYREHSGEWRIPVRTTSDTLCLRFVKPHTKGSGARTTFSAGTLQILLVKGGAL